MTFVCEQHRIERCHICENHQRRFVEKTNTYNEDPKIDTAQDSGNRYRQELERGLKQADEKHDPTKVVGVVNDIRLGRTAQQLRDDLYSNHREEDARIVSELMAENAELRRRMQVMREYMGDIDWQELSRCPMHSDADSWFDEDGEVK